MENKSIRVSLVIPVYNREKALPRCMEAALNQSFEDMEVVIVDDQSTDRSVEVVKKYMELYPQRRIVLCHNKNKGVAGARNTALDNVSGEYVGFLDSDDYIEYNTIEKMYAAIRKGNADIVCTPYWKVEDNAKFMAGRHDQVVGKNYLINPAEKSAFMLQTQSLLVVYLFKTELFRRFLPFPEIRIGEDAALIYPAVSYAERIAYLNEPFYYYELSSTSICATRYGLDLASALETSIITSLERSNPKYRPEIAQVSIWRIHYNWQRWRYRKDLVAMMQRLMPKLVDYLPESAYESQTVADMLILAQKEEWIPRRIYVDGFSKQPDTAWLKHLKKNAFSDGEAEVVVLSPENCSVKGSVAERAFHQGKLQQCAAYFACEKIHEVGGIFLSQHMHLIDSLDSVRIDKAFFAYKDEENFTDHIFGGIAGEEVFDYLLRGIKRAGEAAFDSLLSVRIRTVLCGGLGVSISGKEAMTSKHVRTYDASRMVLLEAQNEGLTYQDIDSLYEGETTTVSAMVAQRYAMQFAQVEKYRYARSRNYIINLERNLRTAYERLHQIDFILTGRTVEEVLESWSYKIGRFITAIPRKTITAIRVAKEEGKIGIMRVIRMRLKLDEK